MTILIKELKSEKSQLEKDIQHIAREQEKTIHEQFDSLAQDRQTLNIKQLTQYCCNLVQLFNEGVEVEEAVETIRSVQRDLQPTKILKPPQNYLTIIIEEYYFKQMEQKPDEQAEFSSIISDLDNHKFTREQSFNILVYLCETQRRIEHQFNEIDKNGNGKISKKELKAHFQGNEAVSNKVIKNMIKVGDLDGDGQIDIDEFVRVMMNSKKRENQKISEEKIKGEEEQGKEDVKE